MDYLKQWLNDEGYRKFKEAKILNDETSKSDSETEPYASKYKARDIYKSLKNKIEDFTEDSGCTDLVSLDEITLMLGDEIAHDDVYEHNTADLLVITLNYYLAMNFIECEEVSTGEEYLSACLESACCHSNSPMYACISISVNNQLSIVWYNRGSFEKALEYLAAAEEIYTKTKNNGIECPFDFNEIWVAPEEKIGREKRRSFFESLHTLTLYYLAQVYMKLENLETSARYCHVTLVRQMEAKDYSPLDWSLNCATLSQYYIGRNNFTFSRYCLACAESVNKEAFSHFETIEFSECNEKEIEEEKLCKSRADIYRCWAKYGLSLLQLSHSEMAGETRESYQGDNSVDRNGKSSQEFRFPNMEVSIYEDRIADTPAKDYAAAKSIFTFSLKQLERAKEFYKLDGYVSDHVEVTQDISQLNKFFAFFHNDFDTRAKMHKRRINMLNDILVELNTKHFLQISRQLTFEIAETYREMVSLKKAIIEEDRTKFSAHAVKKINYLILQGIKYYTAFVDSYKQDEKLPTKFEDDDVRGVLLSYFCMARLNSTYCTSDKQTKAKYLFSERECYEFIVDYCDNHQDMPKVFEEEVAVSREMLALFSGKMDTALNKLS